MKKTAALTMRLHPVFLYALLAIAVVVGVRSQLVVQRVVCQVDGQACSSRTIESLESSLRGHSIFFSSIEQLSATASQSESLTLKSYVKKLPSTVVLEFTSEPALYTLQIQEAEVRTVGALGTIKSHTANSDLPQVRIASTDTHLLEQVSSDNTLPAAMHEPIKAMLAALSEEQMNAQEITWVSDEEIWVQLNSVRFVIDARHPGGSVQAAAQILDTLQSSPLPEPVREIDLRFTLPVLRTAQ